MADREQRPDRRGLLVNPTVASAMEPGFTPVDLLLIPFWGCLLFPCLTILHLLVQLGRCWTAVLAFSFVSPWLNRETPLAYAPPRRRCRSA